MKKWAVVNKTTGQIEQTLASSAGSRPRGVDEALFDIVEVTREVDCETHYVDGGRVKERPEMLVTITEVAGKTRIEGLPDVENVRIVAPGVERQERGGKPVDVTTPDTRDTIIVERFPYRTRILTVGREDKAADMERIADPAVRDFLKKYL